MEKARLDQYYTDNIRQALLKELALNNIMSVPKIDKIVLNVGVKEAVSNSKALSSVVETLEMIAGQKVLMRKAKKSIAGFKLREGMLIGATVTLRRRMMYEFLDRLINIALPKVRDFQGVNNKFDGKGNYNLGIKDWSIFPEVAFQVTKKPMGMNVTIHTTAKKDEHGKALLEKFSVPFKRSENKGK